MEHYSKIDTIKELEEIIPILSDAYYNDEPLVTDYIFDKLVEKLKEKNPDSKILKQIGAPIRDDKSKIKLPYWMGGMDKMKPDSNELRIYLSKYKGPYLLSDKIDGAACLLEYKKGKLKGIYTRGDNGVGQDLKYLIGYLNVKNIIDLKDKNVYIKGELTVSIEDYLNKFSEEATKPRGVVTGIYNSLEPNINTIKNLIFLAFEINIKNEDGNLYPPSEQFKLLTDLGFNTPTNKVIKNINSKILTNYLLERRKKSLFEIDGIIVSNNEAYKEYKKGNPKHSIAFKVNEEGVKTKIIDIEWNPTKHKILFPTIILEPIIIDGDTIKRVSGKNAKYIKDNNLGKGSIISIVKSGGVIPDIAEIIESKGYKFPDLDFKWDKNEVNIVLEGDINEIVKMKALLHFFTSLDIKGVKEGSIKAIYDYGFKSINDVINAKKEDFLNIDGFKEKKATNIYNAIHQIVDNPIPLHDLMFASFCFDKGLGSRRFKTIVDKIDIFNNLKKEEILEVEGFSEILADQFIIGLEKFKEFLKNHPSLKYIKINNNINNNIRYIVFSGFRDKELEKKLIEKGDIVENNITKKTTLLVVKDLDETSNKIIKAKENNIEIILKDDFKI